MNFSCPECKTDFHIPAGTLILMLQTTYTLVCPECGAYEEFPRKHCLEWVFSNLRN